MAKQKMNQLLLFFCLSLFVLDLTHASDQKINAENFAKLALNCVHKEYPNKISHTMQSDADVMPPRELYPSFFGCYDWHSSVHGHEQKSANHNSQKKMDRVLLAA